MQQPVKQRGDGDGNSIDIGKIWVWQKSQHPFARGDCDFVSLGKVAMGNKDCVLTLQGFEALSKSQIANIAQAIANVCQTNVRIPMVFRNGLFMEMQYQAA